MKVLCKMGRLWTNDEFVHNTYKKFSNSCFDKNTDILTLKRGFKDIGDMFIRSNKLDDFYDKTLNLTERLKSNGNMKLSDMLVNELGKMCLYFNKPNHAEEALKMAVENCRRKNDGLHELARLSDLEILYRNNNSRHDLFRVLRRKKECCKRILKNYEENVANYDSIVKAPTSKEGVQVQLAFTYSDLAKMIEKRKPLDAIKMYQKSRDIYSSLNALKEVRYYDKRIGWLKERYDMLSLNNK